MMLFRTSTFVKSFGRKHSFLLSTFFQTGFVLKKPHFCGPNVSLTISMTNYILCLAVKLIVIYCIGLFVQPLFHQSKLRKMLREQQFMYPIHFANFATIKMIYNASTLIIEKSPMKVTQIRKHQSKQQQKQNIKL